MKKEQTIEGALENLMRYYDVSIGTNVAACGLAFQLVDSYGKVRVFQKCTKQGDAYLPEAGSLLYKIYSPFETQFTKL